MNVDNSLSGWSRRVGGLGVVLALALLSGCATGPNANPRDPFEPYNRRMTEFNDQVDALVLRPVAVAYREVTPALVRTGVSNFFANLTDPWSAVNQLLQARPAEALENTMRFAFNSVFGLAGLLDIASELGLERHRADLGQTLGRWGIDTGPYLVLPLLGPSTVRDTLAMSVEARGDLMQRIDPADLRSGLYGLRLVDRRATLLRATEVLDEAALDRYSFTRDVWLQRRGARLQEDDGDPPR